MTTITVNVIRKISGNYTYTIDDTGRITYPEKPQEPEKFRRVTRAQAPAQTSPAPAAKITPGALSGKENHTGGKMKALSVRQPYAGLIIAGIKNVENRTRAPSGSIGMMAIVSTAKPESAQWFNQARAKVQALGYTFPEALCSINGAILGVVVFDYCVWQADDGATETDHPTIEPEDLTAWWNPDFIGFIFEDPRRLAVPIPASGMMGIYTLPGDIERAILEQLAKTS